jgi:O-antigen ligase
MIATLLIMGVFFYMTISLIGDNILERLFDSSDDTGSGRLNIWQSLIQRLASQDIEAWILGNGHLSTTLYSWENLSAHNDFLEIIYDYGIINFLAYFAFFVSLARYTLQAIREKNAYAPSLAMMLVIYTILSMISIIVLSHTCTLAIISFGVLIGWNEHSKKSLEQS